MNTATIAGIIITTAGLLIVGMAALIKTMVLGKLDSIQSMVSGLSRDMHRMDVRLTTLEAEHRMNTRCPRLPHAADEFEVAG